MTDDYTINRTRQEALAAFYKAHKPLGLGSVRQWAAAAKLGYNTVNEAVRLKKIKKVEPETWQAMANGAAARLGRPVGVHELTGEPPPPPPGALLSSLEQRFLATLSRYAPDVQEAKLRAMEAEADALGLPESQSLVPPPDASPTAPEAGAANDEKPIEPVPRPP